MTSNLLLKKLGYSDTDRLVILHTDDIGMCQASLQAFEDLWDFGTISSGAVMVPCPWFPATAEFCRAHPDVDMGVHATLNAEWDAYRWAPLSTHDVRTGLVDGDGYFHQWHPPVWEGADPLAVATELEAQVERALAAGVDVTHIDSHMGTILHPKFVHAYLQAGSSRRIPNMMPRTSGHGLGMLGYDEQYMAAFTPLQEDMESRGLPIIDEIVSLPLERDLDHIGLAKKLLEGLPAGITHFIFHPSTDTPELRAIAPDWPARVANYKAFMSREIKHYIKNSGLQVIGYRRLRDFIRQ